MTQSQRTMNRSAIERSKGIDVPRVRYKIQMHGSRYDVTQMRVYVCMQTFDHLKTYYGHYPSKLLSLALSSSFGTLKQQSSDVDVRLKLYAKRQNKM